MSACRKRWVIPTSRSFEQNRRVFQPWLVFVHLIHFLSEFAVDQWGPRQLSVSLLGERARKATKSAH